MPVVDSGFEAALVEEAGRKSSVLWLAIPGAPQPLGAWHVWVDGAAVVVHEGDEQKLPGLRSTGHADLVLRSKDKGGLLVRVPARVVPLEPGTDAWDKAVAALHAARQSAPDGEAQPARWAAASQVTRLEPDGPATEAPGSYRTDDRRAVPSPTEATTLHQRPTVIGRRSRRRPKL
jgi:hypothetical protein